MPYITVYTKKHKKCPREWTWKREVWKNTIPFQKADFSACSFNFWTFRGSASHDTPWNPAITCPTNQHTLPFSPLLPYTTWKPHKKIFFSCQLVSKGGTLWCTLFSSQHLLTWRHNFFCSKVGFVCFKMSHGWKAQWYHISGAFFSSNCWATLLMETTQQLA